VKGYIAEKQSADECLKSLENRNEALIKETERLRARLRVLETSQEDVAQREQDLAHQQHTLELNVDDASKGMYYCRCVTAVSSLLVQYYWVTHVPFFLDVIIVINIVVCNSHFI